MNEVGFGYILERKICTIDGEVKTYYEIIDCDWGFLFEFESGIRFVSLSSNLFKMFPINYTNDFQPFCVGFKTFYQLTVENDNKFDINLFLSNYKKNIGKYFVYNFLDKIFIPIKDNKLIKVIKSNKKDINESSNNENIEKNIPEGLLKYGEVLTNKNYYCNPAITRDKEIEQLELGLLTPKKSPLIVGEPGVGKTAIVEGLAYKIQNNDVPLILKNKTIFNVETASLIKGCQYVGMVEKNIKELIDEIKGREDVILFIDEFHTLIGLGMGSKSNIDVANILKPYLANGEIKIIGATTLNEYNNIILQDKAFARRFKVINILEPKLESVIEILKGSIPYYEFTTNIKFDFSEEDRQIIFKCLAGLTERINRIQNKNYPDITLEILAESFAFAALNSRKSVLIHDMIKSIENSSTVNEEIKNSAIENLEKIMIKKNIKS